jgi:hypothetical protein
MSLTFDLTRIKNSEEIVDSPITEAVIWATTATGINEITEQNYEDFYKRVNAGERVFGTFLTHEGKPVFLKLEDIQRLVGLQTNASPKRLRDFIYELGNRIYNKI